MTGRRRSRQGAEEKLALFDAWLRAQPARHRVVVAGNHDHLLESAGAQNAQPLLPSAVYLCNSGVELLGLHLWGSPLSAGRSRNSAFQSAEFRAATRRAAAALPPGSIDVLVTHGREDELAGLVSPQVTHVYGHLHQQHGVRWSARRTDERVFDAADAAERPQWLTVCAPVMDGRYRPNQPPIVLDLPAPAGIV